MNTVKKFNKVEAKKLISDKTKELEKRMFEAKDNLVLWEVLEEAKNIIVAENQHWVNMVADEDGVICDVTDETIVEAMKFIDENNNLIEKFEKVQEEIRPNALQIQITKINSRLMKDKIITPRICANCHHEEGQSIAFPIELKCCQNSNYK